MISLVAGADDNFFLDSIILSPAFVTHLVFLSPSRILALFGVRTLLFCVYVPLSKAYEVFPSLGTAQDLSLSRL